MKSKGKADLAFKVKGGAVKVPIFTRKRLWEAREKLESQSLGRLKLCKLVGGCDQCAFFVSTLIEKTGSLEV